MTKTNESGASKSKIYTLFVIIIAIICSVLLWLYVLGYDSPDFEKKFSQIPVTLVGTDELYEKTGYGVLGGLDFSFDVTVAGKKTDVNSMRDVDITAYVDVSGVTLQGGTYLPINVVVPNGITVSAKSVSSAYLVIDEMVTAEIPLKIELTDYKLPENAVLGDYTASPKSVTVEGPKSEVAKIKEAYAKVELGEISSSVTVNTSVELQDGHGNPINPSVFLKQIDKSVTVNLPVYVTKVLPVRVQFIGGIFSAENAVITLSDTTVKVLGASSTLAAIDEVVLNIDETTLDTHTSLVKRIVLPEGVENISGFDSVTVEIQLNQMGRRTVPADREAFELKNVPEGVDIQIITQSLNIDFVGPVDLMRYFSSKYFKVVIDFDGIGVQSGDNFFVPVEIVLIEEQPGVYVSGDYSVNVIVN